jgi:pyrroloquinoline quinone biosynthesis protein B
MILRVLGSAAGGGVPQWNCACVHCTAVREGRAPRRTQSCAAIGSEDGGTWTLLNCSPDIAQQIEEYAPLQPRARGDEQRDTPIAGVLLTDANVDHIGGLAVLRQDGSHSFTVRSSESVRALATAQPAFARFAAPPHRWLCDAHCEPVNEEDPIGNRFAVRAFPVPGRMPGYAGRTAAKDAVFAFAISDRRSGGRLLFAPVYEAIDDVLLAAIAQADVALLDGSFYSDDELRAGGLMDKCARDLGHLPVGDSDGTLDRLEGVRTRVIFTHLNNSNPMLDSTSEAAQRVGERGFEIAYDGLEVVL